MAENLDTPTSKELHDRAVKYAVRHGDLRFLWRLLEQIPAAEEMAGDQGEGEADIVNVASLLHDYIHSGDGEVADALRSTYLDYLNRHNA